MTQVIEQSETTSVETIKKPRFALSQETKQILRKEAIKLTAAVVVGVATKVLVEVTSNAINGAIDGITGRNQDHSVPVIIDQLPDEN